MTWLDRILGWFGIEPVCEFHKSLDQCRLDDCEVWKWHKKSHAQVKDETVFWLFIVLMFVGPILVDLLFKFVSGKR